MNAAFKSMSNVVADAEDLLLRIGRSDDPRVRALMGPVRLATDQLKEQLRERVRRLSNQPKAALTRLEMRRTPAAAAVFLAVGCLVCLITLSRRRR